MIDLQDLQTAITDLTTLDAQNNPVEPTDAEVLARLQDINHFSVSESKMVSPDMMIHFITKNGCFDSLSTSADPIAKGFWFSLETGGVTEYNLKNGHPVGIEQQGMLAHLVSVNAVNQAFADEVIGYANRSKAKYVSLTLMDIKKARYPIGWQAVTIASGNDKVVVPEGDSLISASNAGAFRFTVNPAENFNGQIQIRIKAKKAEDTNFGLFSQFTITFNDSFVAGQPVFQVFKRVAALSGFRHFIFEYQAPYAGAVSSVVVENV